MGDQEAPGEGSFRGAVGWKTAEGKMGVWLVFDPGRFLSPGNVHRFVLLGFGWLTHRQRFRWTREKPKSLFWEESFLSSASLGVDTLLFPPPRAVAALTGKLFAQAALGALLPESEIKDMSEQFLGLMTDVSPPFSVSPNDERGSIQNAQTLPSQRPRSVLHGPGSSR